jgi:phosphate-selective porin OprO/OprP
MRQPMVSLVLLCLLASPFLLPAQAEVSLAREQSPASRPLVYTNASESLFTSEKGLDGKAWKGLRLASDLPKPVSAQAPETSSADLTPPLLDGLPVAVRYGKHAFQFRTHDNLFSLAIQNRIQFRYANPFDSDPRSLRDLSRDQSSFMIRRARTKLNGHAYWSWLKYAMQYDWKDPILRDLNLTVDKYAWLKLWVGRGKVQYNDERVTSSGRQQFVNRSIVNDLFTVDRQEGVQLSGHLFPGTWHDLSYAAGVFTGLGVGEGSNDDGQLMYSGRLQWNALGGVIPFSQSDILPHQQPALNVAVAAATNQSKCTAFATADNSCLSLPGFTVGEAGQYRMNQIMEEIRFRWQGLSMNHELHWKQVVDTQKSQADATRTTGMLGGLVQVGYFPHMLFPGIPKNLEFAGRYAFVDPNAVARDDLQQEISGVITYFLSGHENKLSLQFSHLMVADPQTERNQAAQRLWLQWDISF